MKRIEALDTEVRALEARLGEPHAGTVLREPGIGGACPECGELYASDAHYCARCGTPLDARSRARHDAAVAAAVQQTTGSHPVAEPAPASLLWAAGPRPTAKPEDQAKAADDDTPSEVTSQWLTLPPRPETNEEPPAAPAESAEPAAAAEPEPAAVAEPETVDEAPPVAEPETVAEPVAPKPKRTRARKAPAKPREKAPEEPREDAAPDNAPAEKPEDERRRTRRARRRRATTRRRTSRARKCSRRRRATTRRRTSRATEVLAETPGDDAPADEPRTEVLAETPGEEAPADQPRTEPLAENPGDGASEEPTFEPAPNGRPGSDVPDPLTSRRDDS